jgi:outer membrane biosynthesis protein TonB
LFSALAQEQIFHPPRRRGEDARRQAASFALVALVYGGIVATLLLERLPPIPVTTREIPVEVIVAPPPQPAPPQPEPKRVEKPKQPDREEKPAYDAPKAGVAKEEDIDRKLDAKPPPAAEAAARPAQASSGADGQQAPEPEATPDAIPDTPIDAPPPLKSAEDGEVPPPAAQAPSLTPAAPSTPRLAAGKGRLFAALPNVEFGGAPMKAPVAGGEGPADYLNILVGLIHARLHKPRLSSPVEGAGFGLIVFRLNVDGSISESWFSQHSGSPELDRAEMDALTAAAPYPRPPYIGRAIKYHYVVD